VVYLTPRGHVLSGAIMTHPKRAAAALALRGSAPPGLFEIVTDPEPAGRPHTLRSAMAAWSAASAECTHHIVVQDDIVLPRGFLRHVTEAVDTLPDAALALYSNWNSRNGAAVRMAVLAGLRWVEAVSEYTPTAALILPRALALGYEPFARELGGRWSDDLMMLRYLRHAGVPTYLAVPCVVDHGRLPSLVDNDVHGDRRAACHPAGGPPVLTGAGRIGTVPVVPFFKRGRAQCATRLSGTYVETIGCEQYLARLGIPVERYRHGVETMDRVIEPDVTWQVWLTAFTMGVTATVHSGRDPRLVDLALATIGPGGLCDSTPSTALAGMSDRLRRIARAGLDAGYSARSRAVEPVHRRKPGRSVAVTRGGGVIGEYVARRLADSGLSVRSIGPVPDHRHPGIDYLPADAGTAAFAGATVVHLAELDDAYGPVPGTSRPHDLHGLLAACAAAGADRVVHVSAPATETPAPSSGPVPLALVRIGLPYGPGVERDTVLSDLIRGALRYEPLDAGSPGPPVRLVSVDEIGAGLAALLVQPVLPAVVDLGDPGPWPTHRLARLVAAVVRDVDVVGAPDEPCPVTGASTVDGIRAYAHWLAYESRT
jgi:nucleoside-diphosphate-sugar epimerase